MRAAIQRVSRAEVRVEGRTVGKIGRGLAVLVAVGPGDGPAQRSLMLRKILHLRIFADDAGKFNRSLADIGGEALLVSQFTLYADCRKGRRPSFAAAAPPAKAQAEFDALAEALRAEGIHTETGVFGAMMDVELVNDGPVTIWLDTEDLAR